MMKVTLLPEASGQTVESQGFPALQGMQLGGLRPDLILFEVSI